MKGGYNREVLLSYQVNKNLVLYEPELDNAKHLYLPWNEKNVFMIVRLCSRQVVLAGRKWVAKI